MRGPNTQVPFSSTMKSSSVAGSVELKFLALACYARSDG